MREEPNMKFKHSIRVFTLLLAAAGLLVTVMALPSTAQTGDKGPEPDVLVPPLLGGLDVPPGLETQGFGNNYVLLDSTDVDGPNFNTPGYSPVQVSGVSDFDDAFELVPIGFSFEFYGTTYTDAFISSNGYLTFAAGNTSTSAGDDDLAVNTFIDDPGIFPFWDDLFPGQGGEVRYDTFGPAGNGVFVVLYDDVFRFGAETSGGTFQIRLFEADGRIEFHYADVEWGAADIDYGVDALVGIRAGTAGTSYLQYQFDSGDLTNGLAVRFWPATCGGQDADIVGDRGDNFLFGTVNADVMYAHHGVDTVYGGNGGDYICGGNGGDFLYGEGGADAIFGQSGGDEISGGPGDDDLYGGAGNDVMMGNGDTDYIYGQGNNDTIDGGAGGDFLYGSTGLDTITGGAGDDLVNGGAGNDTLSGGADDDEVIGGGGNDIITGGTGDDFLRGFGGDDDIDGNDGIDTISGGGAEDTLDGWAGVDTITGGPGDDEINGGADDDFIWGNGGDDFIEGSSGVDEINGSGGEDEIYGGSGADIINGGPDNDTIYGGDDNDTINGAGGDDTLNGGGGTANALDGGGGTMDTCNVDGGGTTVRCEF